MNEKASKTQNKKIDSPIEEQIISLLQKEAAFFVPNKIASIEEKLFVDSAPMDDTLFLKNKIHAESEDLIPDVKNEILKATKAERPINCWVRRNHAVAFSLLTSFIVAIIGLSTMIAIRPWQNENDAIVSLEILPASSEKETSKNHNPYTPSFLFRIGKNGKAIPSSLRASNYSASLIKKSPYFSSIEEGSGASLAASLLRPAYEMGYLEKTDYDSPNKIKVTYFSMNAKQTLSKEKEYLSIFDQTLKKKRDTGLGIYASVSFQNGFEGLDLSVFSKLNINSKILLAATYANSSTNVDSHLISFSDLLSTEPTILNALSDTLFSIRKAKLSPYAMYGVLKATATAFSSIQKEITISQNEIIDEKKKELISKVDSFVPDSDSRKETIKQQLTKDAYYLVELPKEDEQKLSQGEIFSSFFEIRNLIYQNLSWDRLKILLQEEKELAESETTFFDASELIENQAPLDSGEHKKAALEDALDEEGGVIDN